MEHESKVYKFEKNVIGNMAIDDMNPEYDNEYDKYSDRDYDRARNDFDYRSVSNVSHSQRLSKRSWFTKLQFAIYHTLLNQIINDYFQPIIKNL